MSPIFYVIHYDDRSPKFECVISLKFSLAHTCIMSWYTYTDSCPRLYWCNHTVIDLYTWSMTSSTKQSCYNFSFWKYFLVFDDVMLSLHCLNNLLWFLHVLHSHFQCFSLSFSHHLVLFLFYLYIPLILKMPRTAKNIDFNQKSKELVTIESKTDELTWGLSWAKRVSPRNAM